VLSEVSACAAETNSAALIDVAKKVRGKCDIELYYPVNLINSV
jgi:hypothetical protein